MLQSNYAHDPLVLVQCSRGQEAQVLSVPAAGTEAHESQSLCSTEGEATAMRSLCTATREQPSLAATREKPVQLRRPSRAKTKCVNKIKKKKKVLHYLKKKRIACSRCVLLSRAG